MVLLTKKMSRDWKTHMLFYYLVGLRHIYSNSMSEMDSLAGHKKPIKIKMCQP